MQNEVNIYVELLDEGVETWVPARAKTLGNGLFEVLEPADYDPEDQAWEFTPGSKVRLKEKTFYTGVKGMVAIHPDPKAIRIFVESSETYAPPLRETHALDIGNGLFEMLPTPHYSPSQKWKFSPGSIVSLKEVRPNIKGFPDYKYWLAVEKVG